MAGEWSGRPFFLVTAGGKGGVTLRQCTITDCGGASISLDKGPFEMTGCDLRRADKLFPGDDGLFVFTSKTAPLTLRDNTIRNVPIYGAGCEAETIIRNNIFILCNPAGFVGDKALTEENYVHQPLLTGSYGLLNLKGTTRNNVVRGGSWNTCGLGGTITGNVLEAMTDEEIKKSADASWVRRTTLVPAACSATTPSTSAAARRRCGSTT
jgi:hypothetical protein